MPCLNRREFLGATAAGWIVGGEAAPDFQLRIGKIQLELSPGKTFTTTGFNGTAPGPLIRVKEGQRITIDVTNETSEADIVHWHGLKIPSNVDGAIEEGTPMVSAKSTRRYSFVATPSGTRWYHTHGMAKRNLNRATYTGEFGFFYIEPRVDPGAYDVEQFLAFREWDAYFTIPAGGDSSLEVGYKYFSVNSHSLGFGEPIRVKAGQRLLLHMLNASATMHRRIALAGHRFQVIAMDGNPVAHPTATETLEFGPAERIDAIVEMTNPGIWILGAISDHDRNGGLGIVVEYSGKKGEAQWLAPNLEQWDYRKFGAPGEPPTSGQPKEIPLVFERKWAGNNWVDHWLVNGKPFPKNDRITLRANERYRLVFDNRSTDPHPVHLHRHTFELVEVGNLATRGVWKDVVVVPPKQVVKADFTADNPGNTLFHCHQQMHMDYGFMALFQYS